MDKPAISTVYAYFDGDDVGANIELLLISDDPVGAANVSASVSAAVRQLATGLEKLGATVLFSAGDEVLATFAGKPHIEQIEVLREQFLATSSLTVSCGLGTSGQEATLQLRLAKLRGKNRLTGEARCMTAS